MIKFDDVLGEIVDVSEAVSELDAVSLDDLVKEIIG